MKKLIFLILIPPLILIGFLNREPFGLTKPSGLSEPQTSKPFPVLNFPEPFEPSGLTTKQLHDYVNKERVNKNLSKLSPSPKLKRSATAKCNHMLKHGYWDHVSPDGVTPWYFIRKEMNYIKAGENLAVGYSESRVVVKGWMGSPSHRKNILEDEYSKVGYAICGTNRMVVQHLAD